MRQTREDKYLTELYVVPATPALREPVLKATQQAIASLARTYPGISVDERGGDIHISVPAALRDGHEAHFAQVASNFLRYARDRRALPAWERPNMLAKYFVTTTGTELSRRAPPRAARRRAPR